MCSAWNFFPDKKNRIVANLSRQHSLLIRIGRKYEPGFRVNFINQNEKHSKEVYFLKNLKCRANHPLNWFLTAPAGKNTCLNWFYPNPVVSAMLTWSSACTSTVPRHPRSSWHCSNRVELSARKVNTGDGAINSSHIFMGHLYGQFGTHSHVFCARTECSSLRFHKTRCLIS